MPAPTCPLRVTRSHSRPRTRRTCSSAWTPALTSLQPATRSSPPPPSAPTSPHSRTSTLCWGASPRACPPPRPCAAWSLPLAPASAVEAAAPPQRAGRWVYWRSVYRLRSGPHRHLGLGPARPTCLRPPPLPSQAGHPQASCMGPTMRSCLGPHPSHAVPPVAAPSAASHSSHATRAMALCCTPCRPPRPATVVRAAVAARAAPAARAQGHTWA